MDILVMRDTIGGRPMGALTPSSLFRLGRRRVFRTWRRLTLPISGPVAAATCVAGVVWAQARWTSCLRATARTTARRRNASSTNIALLFADSPMLNCEQCGTKTAAYIWSDDDHFPGVYLCSKCVRQPNRKSERLLTLRRPRGPRNLSDFTHGLTQITGFPARLGAKWTPSP